MQIQIKLFGQLTDITKTNKLILENVMDTNSLNSALQEQFPALKNSKYIIAVDRKIISENTTLHQTSDVALLPPFSGG